MGRRRSLPAGHGARRARRAPARVRSRRADRDHRGESRHPAIGAPRPPGLPPAIRRGDPGQGRPRPPARRRRRRAGDPRRGPVPGARPRTHPARRRRRERVVTAAPPRTRALAHTTDARARHRLGLHPTVQRPRGRRAAARAAPERARRSPRGPRARRTPRAARLARARDRRGRARGDGAGRARSAAARGTARAGRDARRRHGARRSGGRAADPRRRRARRAAPPHAARDVPSPCRAARVPRRHRGRDHDDPRRVRSRVGHDRVREARARRHARAPLGHRRGRGRRRRRVPARRRDVVRRVARARRPPRRSARRRAALRGRGARHADRRARRPPHRRAALVARRRGPRQARRPDPRRRRHRRARARAGPLPLPAAAAMREGTRRRTRFLAYLAIAGPGLIAANAGNDAGGIATYASAGSQYRYRTLFFMVLVTVGLVVVQEMSARLGVFTGKGLAALIREEFSIRFATLALACLLLANLGLVVSEFAGIGAALELLGVTRYLSVPVAAVALWALVMFGSYRYAERVFLLLSLVFLTYPIAAVLGHPDWHAVASQTVLPHFTGGQAFVFVGVALIGTTISPYMQLYTAAGVVDRGITADEYSLERVDAVGGAVFGDFIAMCIIIATAAAIGGHGPLSSAKQAAEALRPVAGAGAELLFAIGLLGASALAAAVVPLSTSYAISEAVGVERSVSRRFREAPVFLGLFTFQVFVGALVALTPVNLFTLLIGTQVLEGLVTPVILVFILTLANRRSLLGDAANGPVFRAVAWVCVIAVAVLSSVLLAQTVLGWFGVA